MSALPAPEAAQPINANGVTTDGRGNLLVCDAASASIQMLSASGKHLGAVVRETDQVGILRRHINWQIGSQTLFLVTHFQRCDANCTFVESVCVCEKLKSARTTRKEKRREKNPSKQYSRILCSFYAGREKFQRNSFR